MKDLSHSTYIATELGVNEVQISAAIELLDADNSIPFIARYRKEATGGLSDEQLRQLNDLLKTLRSLDDRRETILRTINSQGNLNQELKQKILAATTLAALEDLYRPYKPKRKTRASMAREKGLEPLAKLILEQNHCNKVLEKVIEPYFDNLVSTKEEALAGARDIIAEYISDQSDIRRETRSRAFKWGILRCEKREDADDPRETFKLYYAFESRVDRIRPHQILAINRGEGKKVLRVKVVVPERDWRSAIANLITINPCSPFVDQLRMAITDAAERLLLPSIERDVRRELTKMAEMHAIKVFADNLRALISQPPISDQTVMGIDPGFRTGCKLAIVDPLGKVLDTATIYPHAPQKQWDRSVDIFEKMATQYGVSLVSIGNGTASRETEQFIAASIRDLPAVRYLIVSEAGASVYSASELARTELPNLDVSMRGAVSIARRVIDPLAELVKIDPKSIGVGLYQHDVDQKQLAETLSGVVESVVNQVGVDVNTASPALLNYVAGIGPELSKRIVAYRDENGAFANRREFTSVKGFGPKAFEQAAGFLRVANGENALDGSAIHPESYHIAELVQAKSGITFDMYIPERSQRIERMLASTSIEKLASEIDTGVPTLTDILEQLIRPGRDPRDEVPPSILRSDILKAEDLAIGMVLPGTVRNVVDFGAFIDIGVKNAGLLHRSKISNDISITVGDIIEVEIISLDLDRGRIGLALSSGG